MKTMRAAIALLALTTILTTSMPASAGADESHDHWYAFYVADGKAGYVHEERTRGEEDGRTIWTTTTEVRFSMARLGSPLTIVQKVVVVEDGNGQVIRFSTSAEQGGPPQVTKGTVADGQISLDQMGTKRQVAYPEGAIGPAAAHRKLLEKTPEAGAKVEINTFSPDAPDRAVVTTSTFGEMEKVDVLGRVVMLRKVTATTNLVPITLHLWLDDEGRNLVTEIDMGMGAFRFLMTEKEIALADSEPVEVMTTTFVEPDRPIAKPRSLRRAIYLIGSKDGSTPSIYQGEGQSILLGTEEGKLRLGVLADVPLEEYESFTLPVVDVRYEEYLSPTPYVESDDPVVAKLAAEAIGDETDAVQAARRIESYVREKITKKSLSVGFASAAEVAKTLEGDCTEHAVLCCAIARARGLPARVVTGLVYLPPEDGLEKRWANGIFGYHMWTEVLVADGLWMAIDAAIGTYDATHIALGKSNLSSVSPGLDMMLAVLKVMGSLTIEVIEP